MARVLAEVDEVKAEIAAVKAEIAEVKQLDVAHPDRQRLPALDQQLAELRKKENMLAGVGCASIVALSP